MLNQDNDETRESIEFCYKRRKTVLNPIIDWTDWDVWEFIKEYNIDYCELYDKGYKRLGCIGCPMGSNKKEELEKYPKYKKAYLRAFSKMIAGGKTHNWNTPEDVYNWWIST